MRTKRAVAFLSLVVLMGWGFAQEIRPVAVSPGSERGPARVGERCPTFSWSAVGWAAGYRVAVFEANTAEARSYEAMALGAAPVLTQEIKGKALSWTPSQGQGLKDGGLYIWYVQARDASGNGLWSAGKAFVVEVEKTSIIGLEERVTKKLRTRGVSADVIAEVSNELRDGAPSGAIARRFTPKSSGPTSAGLPSSGGGPGGIITQGSEGDGNFNTYYGANAGSSLDGTGTNNSFFGFNAGRFTTGGDANSFMGYNAGTANTTGYQNAVVGYLAGSSNTTGYQNAFLGAFAGHNNFNGYRNTFLGYSAGSGNITGWDNTFLGYYAGGLNTGGIKNTFIGVHSGYNNGLGCFNTSLGYYAGERNEVGDYNTTIGYCAGYANTANSNSFLGYSSGRDNTTGTYNSFFGQNAGRYNTTGSNNTYLGLNSAYNNITGGNNVVLGVNAGFNSAGSGNVFLGYRAGFSETGSDKLYIDNYSDTFPLIYGDFSAAKLGINGYLGVGVQTPAYRIQVAGGAYCNGTTWTNASSRVLKTNIRDLSGDDAQAALSQLEPVRFNYKADATDECLGFIAEDVPGLLATPDRKGLSPMDIVAVLTKVVQEQQRTIRDQQKLIDVQQRAIDEILSKIDKLERKKN